jgi:DNA-binding winged helix-turn-helix (wHTH) protein/tetratricopeptide (TPR) repeat protein
MSSVRQWLFEPFRLDATNACLWRDAAAIPLKPKTFAVLQCLVTRAGQLVTKEILLNTVWSGTVVGDGVLKVCIAELRKALGDTAQTPRFIATVHRRGYRFLAPVTPVAPSSVPSGREAQQPLATTHATAAPHGTASGRSFARPDAAPLVGREAVLAGLHAALVRVRQHRRQMVFVTGEPGIGKTAVVEAFVAQAMVTGPLRVAYGQCVEHYGRREAYLPVLEALGQLCRQPDGEHLVAVLRQQAPTWLVQMPWLLSADDRSRLQHELVGATRERMLRECAEMMDTLTAESPLLLVLEDLHWSDYATLDLLALLARRRMPARLMVLGTYRPVEVIVQQHPLRTVAEDLQRQGHSTELSLTLLSEAAVEAYLARRFPGHQFPATLAPWLQQYSDGHPLFLVTMVQTLIERGVLSEDTGHWHLQGRLADVAAEVPEELRPILEQQFVRLPPAAQQLLEVASVAGIEFVVDVVAAGLEADVTEVEEGCEGLVRQQMLRSGGLVTWPDGAVTARYAFVHGLYQQVAYQRLGEGRRLRLHQRLGTYLETAYGAQVERMAAELAEHFARSRDRRRAVQYLRQAAENSLRRYAHREAVRCYEQALKVLQPLPAQREIHEQMIDLHLDLRNALVPLGEIARIFTCLHDAETLARALDDRPRLGRIAAYMTRHFFLMGEQAQAIACGEQALALGGGDMALQVATHLYLGYAYHALGNYRRAIDVLQKNITVLPGPLRYDHYGLAPLPSVSSNARLAQCFAELGEFPEGRHYGEQALEIAETAAHPFSLNQACRGLGILYLRQGAFGSAIALLERGLALCRDADLPLEFPIIAASLGSAYALSDRLAEAIPLLEQAVAQAVSMQRLDQQALRLVALGEGYWLVGRGSEALLLAQEALERARTARERGVEGYVLGFLGTLATHGVASTEMSADTAYRHAITLAEELGMRPLLAHCFMGLGTLYSQRRQWESARTALTNAIVLLRAMEMPFWLLRAQTALSHLP